jgi:hypothetical protein
LGFPAWNGLSPSDEICPCCGIQFGYTDAAGGDLQARERLYQEWRLRWIAQGMLFKHKGNALPQNWDPISQLKRIGVNVKQN